MSTLKRPPPPLTLYQVPTCDSHTVIRPSLLTALSEQGTPFRSYRLIQKCTKQEARKVRMVHCASLAGCLAAPTCLFSGSEVESGSALWSEPANKNVAVYEEEQSPCQDLIRQLGRLEHCVVPCVALLFEGCRNKRCWPRRRHCTERAEHLECHHDCLLTFHSADVPIAVVNY